MNCPNCNAYVRDGDMFCGECGARVPAAPAQPSYSAPPPEMPAPPPPPPSQPAPAYTPPTYSSTPPPPAGGGYAPPPPTQGGYAPAEPKKNRTGCIILAVVGLLALCCVGPVVSFFLVPSLIPTDVMDIIDEILGTPTVPIPNIDNPTTDTTDPLPNSTTQIVVENFLNVDVCFLYISPTTSDEWGDDWLGDEILSAGDTMVFTLQAGSTVDIQAVDCDLNVLDEQYDVYVWPEGLTYTLSPNS